MLKITQLAKHTRLKTTGYKESVKMMPNIVDVNILAVFLLIMGTPCWGHVQNQLRLFFRKVPRAHLNMIVVMATLLT